MSGAELKSRPVLPNIAFSFTRTSTPPEPDRANVPSCESASSLWKDNKPLAKTELSCSSRNGAIFAICFCSEKVTQE